jgi:hypothetical protein
MRSVLGTSRTCWTACGVHSVFASGMTRDDRRLKPRCILEHWRASTSLAVDLSPCVRGRMALWRDEELLLLTERPSDEIQ